MKLLVSVLLVGVSLGAFAQDILKMKHLHEIASHVEDGDWVIFDVDYTLLEGQVPVVGARSVLHDLHQINIPVFCLTATPFQQSIVYKERFLRAGLAIDHTSTLFGLNDINPNQFGRENTGYYCGCIFAPRDPELEDSAKGPALVRFLELIEDVVPLLPKRILFVDDQERNLISVQNVLPNVPKVLFHFNEKPKYIPPVYALVKEPWIPRPKHRSTFWDDILLDRPLHYWEWRSMWR